jgi:hypothetical protein
MVATYDLVVSAQPENIKPSLTTALNKPGLERVEEPRTIKKLRPTPVTAGK